MATSLCLESPRRVIVMHLEKMVHICVCVCTRTHVHNRSIRLFWDPQTCLFCLACLKLAQDCFIYRASPPASHAPSHTPPRSREPAEYALDMSGRGVVLKCAINFYVWFTPSCRSSSINTVEVANGKTPTMTPHKQHLLPLYSVFVVLGANWRLHPVEGIRGVS